jgi:hypothetical protein
VTTRAGGELGAVGYILYIGVGRKVGLEDKRGDDGNIQ